MHQLDVLCEFSLVPIGGGTMKPQRSEFKFALAVAGIGVMALVGGLLIARADDAGNSLPNPYRQVEGWGKPLPGGRQWGSTNAVTVDSKDNVWVAERCGGNSCADSPLDPILEFDSAGNLIKSFGAGMFVVPHNVYVDKGGNVWATDNSGKDGKGQQVIKFSPDGKELMRLGKAGVAGDGPDTFNQPDAVAVAENGDIFVADGHVIGSGNARIVKFSKDGKFLMQWGEHGSGPGQFEVPHGIALDSRGRIFVADRGNRRIQIFDQNGKFLDQWSAFGAPSGLFIGLHDMLYATDSVSQAADSTKPTYNPGIGQGIRAGSAKDGKVTAFLPLPPPPGAATNSPEGVAADAAGNVYGADVALKGVRKFAAQHMK
jgi:sugar lactone lactonase YvrE